MQIYVILFVFVCMGAGYSPQSQDYMQLQDLSR